METGSVAKNWTFVKTMSIKNVNLEEKRGEERERGRESEREGGRERDRENERVPKCVCERDDDRDRMR